jgi:hypothetical protein
VLFFPIISIIFKDIQVINSIIFKDIQVIISIIFKDIQVINSIIFKDIQVINSIIFKDIQVINSIYIFLSFLLFSIRKIQWTNIIFNSMIRLNHHIFFLILENEVVDKIIVFPDSNYSDDLWFEAIGRCKLHMRNYDRCENTLIYHWTNKKYIFKH